jgi:hypothetical protein
MNLPCFGGNPGQAEARENGSLLKLHAKPALMARGVASPAR